MNVKLYRKKIFASVIAIVGLIPLLQYVESIFKEEPDKFLIETIKLQERALVDFSLTFKLCGLSSQFTLGNPKSFNLLRSVVVKQKAESDKVLDSVDLIKIKNLSTNRFILRVDYESHAEVPNEVQVQTGETILFVLSADPYVDGMDTTIPQVKDVQILGRVLDKVLPTSFGTGKISPECPGQTFQYPKI